MNIYLWLYIEKIIFILYANNAENKKTNGK